MKRSGAWLVRHALERLGVTHTFGIPGVHTTELYDELGRSNQITPILVTHEAGAAFGADAISRTTDTIGTCVLVPAAGLTHAASGIGEAYLAGIPMLVITGGIRTDTGSRYQLHEVDGRALIEPITKAQYLVERHADVVPTIYEAYRTAMSGEPGPVHVEVPVNLQLFDGEAGTLPDPPVIEGPALQPDQIEAAARALACAEHPCIFAGWGAARASEALVRLAELLDAPVATSLQGLSVFPAHHPLHAGFGFGPSASPAGERAFKSCDVMLAVGVRFGEIATGSFGASPPPRLIHIDINPEAIGANHPVETGIVADAADALPALADAVAKTIETRRDTGVRETIAKAKAEYEAEWLRHDPKGRVNPGVFFKALRGALADDAIVVADDGNHTFLAAELMPVHAARGFISPTDFNCMGYCVPAANAAKFASPNRQVAAIVGDGAFLMTGLEALTAKAQGAGVMYFVFADGELSQIAQAQQTPYNRKTCTVLPPVKLGPWAEAVGCDFVSIETDADVEAGVAAAVSFAAEGRPVIVEVNIDYSKPTRFTKGAVATNLKRFDLPAKAKFIGRALKRKVTG